MKMIIAVALLVGVCTNAFAMTWDEVKELYKTDRERQTVYIEFE